MGRKLLLEQSCPYLRNSDEPMAQVVDSPVGITASTYVAVELWPLTANRRPSVRQ